MRSALVFAAALFSLAGCAVQSGPVDDGQVAGAEDGVKKNDPCAVVRCAAGYHCESKGKRAECVADKASCTSDADCRLYDNYCEGCACEALSTSSPDPVCGGTTVSCFVQPCRDKVAVCKAGTCQVADAPAPVTCGSTTCPSGQVCCNASCGICTPPGGMCIQVACE